MNYGQPPPTQGGYTPPGYTQYGSPQTQFGAPQTGYAQPQGVDAYGQPLKKSNLGLILVIVGVIAFSVLIAIGGVFVFVLRAASTAARSIPTATPASTSFSGSDTSSGTEMSLPFLQRVAREASLGLPRMLDSETKEESVTALPGTLVYHNRLVNKTVSQLSVPVFTQILKPEIVSNVCTNPAVRDSLLLKGVTLRYTYIDKFGSFIATLDVTKHDCGF